MVTFDLSLVTNAEQMRDQVAAALEQAGQSKDAASWRRRAATCESVNGLVVLAREYVQVVPWPRPRREGAS